MCESGIPEGARGGRGGCKSEARGFRSEEKGCKSKMRGVCGARGDVEYQKRRLRQTKYLTNVTDRASPPNHAPAPTYLLQNRSHTQGLCPSLQACMAQHMIGLSPHASTITASCDFGAGCLLRVVVAVVVTAYTSLIEQRSEGEMKASGRAVSPL